MIFTDRRAYIKDRAGLLALIIAAFLLLAGASEILAIVSLDWQHDVLGAGRPIAVFTCLLTAAVLANPAVALRKAASGKYQAAREELGIVQQ